MTPRKKKQEEVQQESLKEGQTGAEVPDEEAQLSLEESFERLDEILEVLEREETSLEDSFAMYQKGMALLKRCNEKIDTVEKKILIMNGDGGLDEF